MKSKALLLVTPLFFAPLLATSYAHAREPKATLCAGKALKAGAAIYLANQADDNGFDLNLRLELVEMNHGEGGTEVWNVNAYNEKGTELITTPTRVTVAIDDCTVIKTELVGAG